jgi:hypothetical protein
MLQAGRTLAAQLSARSKKIQAKLIMDGIQTLTTFLERLLEAVVVFEDMANTHPEDDVSGCVNKAKIFKSDCNMHTKAVKILLDKYGPKKEEQPQQQETDQ